MSCGVIGSHMICTHDLRTPTLLSYLIPSHSYRENDWKKFKSFAFITISLLCHR